MRTPTVALAAALATTFGGTTAPAVADAAHPDLTPAQAALLQRAGGVAREIRSIIPGDYWTRAHCVVVVPDLRRAAVAVGGEYGKGVMSCRSGGGWSAPAFMTFGKGTWSSQAGAEEIDVVLLVINESGVQKLLHDSVTLGADATVAAGPIGRQGAVATGGESTAGILAYARGRGVIAGINVSSGVLRPDREANAHVYGAGATPRTVLATRSLSAPPEASAFLDALGGPPATAAAAGFTRQTPEARPSHRGAAAASPSAGDVRTRAAGLERAIDQLLSEPASPVGTSGASGDTVTIDRSRLVRLREQVDELLRAVDSRR